MADLEFESHEGIGRIRINRPAARNAFTTDMWAAMLELLQRIEQDRGIRCVVVSGAGEHFCAGGDVKEFARTLELSTEDCARYWGRSADVTNNMFTLIERIPQPVLVSCRGIAAGGGMALVAAADLAIAADDAQFFAAQIHLGAIPDSGVSYNLVRSVGLKRAKQLGMLGERIDARAALDIGLLNWVVPPADLDARTEEIAVRLARSPGTAMRLTKATFNAAWDRSLADHFVQEARDVMDCVRDPDYAQRVRAFLERRR